MVSACYDSGFVSFHDSQHAANRRTRLDWGNPVSGGNLGGNPVSGGEIWGKSGGNPGSVHHSCPGGNPVSVHHSEGGKSGVSPSFLPKRVKSGVSPSFLPKKTNRRRITRKKMHRHRITPPTPDYAPEKVNRHRAKKLGKGG